jgi:hypothetical protein
MAPGMWWMLVSHLRKQSLLNTFIHSIYYDVKKTIFNTRTLLTTIGNTPEMRSEINNGRKIRIRFYTKEKEHSMLEQ